MLDSLLQTVSTQAAAINHKRLGEKTAGALVKWLYVAAIVLALLWSLLWWGATWFVGMGDEAARAGSGLLAGHLQIPELLVSSAALLQSISESVLLFLWIVGLVVIGMLAAAGRRFIGAFRSRTEMKLLPHEGQRGRDAFP